MGFDEACYKHTIERRGLSDVLRQIVPVLEPQSKATTPSELSFCSAHIQEQLIS